MPEFVFVRPASERFDTAHECAPVAGWRFEELDKPIAMFRTMAKSTSEQKRARALFGRCVPEASA
jgi:hypothetical protein